MKVVIISDIHGNYEALAALPETYDELWVLGDLVNYGPEPGEVIEWVRARATIVVRGNHDHALGFGEDPRCAPRYRAMAELTRQFTESVLSDAQKRFLRELPLCVDFSMEGRRFYLCHAMPSDPLFGYCEPDSARWEADTQGLGADVVMVGHTHLAFLRKMTHCLLVNPGSLGQPKTGSPSACYAVWENGQIELRSYSYPVEKTIAKIERMPVTAEVRADLINVLRTGSLD